MEYIVIGPVKIAAIAVALSAVLFLSTPLFVERANQARAAEQAKLADCSCACIK